MSLYLDELKMYYVCYIKLKCYKNSKLIYRCVEFKNIIGPWYGINLDIYKQLYYIMFLSYFPKIIFSKLWGMWSCSRKFYITVTFSIISCGIPKISSLMSSLCSSKAREQCLKMLAFKDSFSVKKIA